MEYTQKEWLEKLEEHFGEDMEEWKFVCPKCGNVASGRDFKIAGAEPNAMYQECIGRYDESEGCDWAAYGLFGTLGRGDVIMTENGDKVDVFRMAEKGEK